VRVGVLLVGLVASAAYLRAQGTAEASATMAGAGVAARPAQAPSFADSPSRRSGTGDTKVASSRKRTSNSLIVPSGPPPDEVNRKKFEENAGKDAGRVLIRSVPSGASIFLNHMLVGNAPLLLFLAPGKYDVEMRGERQQSGHRILAVIAKQTQTVVIDMNRRYPSRVSLRW
jgi:PEGA domain